MKSPRRAGSPSLLTATLAAAALAAALMPASASAGCPPTPREQGQCLPVGQTSLSIDAYGHFEWRASRAAAATADEFVDSAASYQLCAWDEEHLVVAADIPAGSECRGMTCWNKRDTTWRYSDDVGANGDIRVLDFTGSDEDRTKLHTVTMVIGGIILPVNGGVVVQLARTDNDTCFESFIPADSFSLDDKAAFAAKFSDPSVSGAAE
jgi:hypothetical protein